MLLEALGGNWEFDRHDSFVPVVEERSQRFLERFSQRFLERFLDFGGGGSAASLDTEQQMKCMALHLLVSCLGLEHGGLMAHLGG